jgi:glucose-6-phosphate dehydrogenase assembly protein OpcA
MSDSAPQMDFFGVPVELRHVEKELTRQILSLRTDDTGPLQKVRMSNLVVYTTSMETARKIAEQAPLVEAAHPARVILLIGDRQAKGDKILAAACARSHPLGRTQQAFWEQVTLYAPGALIERLPFAVRSLIIGDLPINLLWETPTPPPLAGPLLAELSENAQQIIYDSLDWPDPVRGVAATGSWLEQTERTEAGQWRVASDLNWRRLKFWRRLTSQALEPLGETAGQLINEVIVEHGPAAVVQAWLLAAWIARRLGWRPLGGSIQQGVEMAWRCATGKNEATLRVRRLAEGPPEVRVVNLTHHLDGQENWLNLFIESEQRLAIELGSGGFEPRTLTLPALSAAEVVSRQLSDREHDPVFRESMTLAQSLARMVLR